VLLSSVSVKSSSDGRRNGLWCGSWTNGSKLVWCLITNYQPAVRWWIHILSCLCSRDRGEWCKSRCRRTSSSSKDTADDDPLLVSKMKWRNKVQKHLDSDSATHTLSSGLDLGKAAPWLEISKKGSYHCCRISLILLHTFGKCLIALSISPSRGSRKAYHGCNQLLTAIPLHPHQSLLHTLPD